MKKQRSLSSSRIQRDGLSIGTAAPSFSLPRVGGGELSFNSYRGRRVLLVFSDPDCGPCNAIAPQLEAAERQLPDLDVLMVSRGGEAANLAKIQEHAFSFPVLLQQHWEISKLFAMFATPIAYLIDTQGLVASHVAVGSLAIRKLLNSAGLIEDPLPRTPGETHMVNSSDTINNLTMTAINTALQSPALQNLTFKVTATCQDSVLNAIYFCNAVEFTESYDVGSVIDQACVDACKGAQNAANDLCDTARQACKTGCAALKGGLDGCYGACDDTRKACKSVCFGNKSCENKCDDVSSSCKKGCDKTFPYDSCNSGCDDVSASCKDAAQSGYNACASGCGYLTLSGGYDVRLVEVGGLGSIAVTSAYDIVVTPADQNVSTLSLDLNVPSTTVQVQYKVWQEPIPPIAGTLPITVNNVAGKGTATLLRVCQGDGSGLAAGYYVQIDDMNIVIPSDIFDYSPWIIYLQAIGIDTSHLTNGINALAGLFMTYADGTLSKILVKELNKVLYTMKIMDCDC